MDALEAARIESGGCRRVVHERRPRKASLPVFSSSYMSTVPVRAGLSRNVVGLNRSDPKPYLLSSRHACGRVFPRVATACTLLA